jgi:hypothetical protein
MTDLDTDPPDTVRQAADAKLEQVTAMLRASGEDEAPPMSADLLIQLVRSEILRHPPGQA